MYIHFLILFTAHHVASLNDDTYTAAVVEYFPIRQHGLSIKDRINANVDVYIELLKNITEPLDIIVYPEQTLAYGSTLSARVDLITSTTLIPSAEEHVSPCDLQDAPYGNFFVRLSCAAKARRVYLSANMLERHKCEGNDCASDGWDVYNTNVVFDRKGYVVARYRKVNLYDEGGVNITAIAERVTFSTDFGVTFGMFICFDILYDEPALKLVQQGIKHFIYPTMWFSELHWSSAIQTQQMWSYGNDAVLLAAGANNPNIASGGSGIYQGRSGSLETHITDVESNKVIVQRVQKHWEPSQPIIRKKNVNSMANFRFWRENYANYSVLNLDEKETQYTIQVQDTTCHFDFKFKVDKALGEHYNYRLMGFSGLRPFSPDIFGGVEVCGIVACLNDTLESCGKRTPADVSNPYRVKFEEISVSITTPKSDKSIHFPNSLLGNFEPLHSDSFTWDIKSFNEQYNKKTIKLIKPCSDIFTFGIFGRLFDKDFREDSPEKDNFLMVTRV